MTFFAWSDLSELISNTATTLRRAPIARDRPADPTSNDRKRPCKRSGDWACTIACHNASPVQPRRHTFPAGNGKAMQQPDDEDSRSARASNEAICDPTERPLLNATNRRPLKGVLQTHPQGSFNRPGREALATAVTVGPRQPSLPIRELSEHAHRIRHGYSRFRQPANVSTDPGGRRYHRSTVTHARSERCRHA